MKTTFLIGNGVDINLGLKTSYNDFYDYYLNLPQDDDHKLILQLKNYIKEYINGKNNNWSDLEVGLGHHTKELKNFEEIEIVYDNINNSIQNYINKVEDNFSTKYEEFDLNLLKINISQFINFLTPTLKVTKKGHIRFKTVTKNKKKKPSK